MKAGEIWGPKGGHDLRALLRVDGTEDGHVLAHPRFGGFSLRIPADEFSEGFEHYPQDRLDAMSERFEETFVGLDDFEEGQDIPCWTNGQTWNGWEVPFFERRHFDAALADGRIATGGGCLIWFDEGVGSYVEIMSSDGESLPDDIDRMSLVEAALKAGGGDEITLPGGNTAYVSIAPIRQIETGEGKVAVYNVGDGWTWSRPAKPEPAVP